MKAFLVTIDPKQDHKMVEYRHEGEEFLYVLKGHVEVRVGENQNLLKKAKPFTSIQTSHINFVISAMKKPNSLSSSIPPNPEFRISNAKIQIQISDSEFEIP